MARESGGASDSILSSDSAKEKGIDRRRSRSHAAIDRRPSRAAAATAGQLAAPRYTDLRQSPVTRTRSKRQRGHSQNGASRRPRQSFDGQPGDGDNYMIDLCRDRSVIATTCFAGRDKENSADRGRRRGNEKPSSGSIMATAPTCSRDRPHVGVCAIGRRAWRSARTKWAQG